MEEEWRNLSDDARRRREQADEAGNPPLPEPWACAGRETGALHDQVDPPRSDANAIPPDAMTLIGPSTYSEKGEVSELTTSPRRHCALPELCAEQLLDALPFPVLLIDDRHMVLFANGALMEHSGRAPCQIVGAHCPTVMHGTSQPFPGCPLEEVVQSGHAVVRELHDPTSDHYVSSAIYPTRATTADGRKVYLHTASDVTESKRVLDELVRSGDMQKVIAGLLRTGLERMSLDAILARALDLILSIPWLALERQGAVFVMDDATNELVMKAHSGINPALLSLCGRVPMGRCLCGLAAQTRTAQFADHVDDRHVTRYEGMPPHGHYCVPILADEKTVLGVINVYTKAGHVRTAAEDGFLCMIADTLAGIIQHQRVETAFHEGSERLRQALEETVAALALAAEKRDPYTAGHQRRAGRLAVAIAGEMGLHEDRIAGLRVAGALHDIGKISVPIEILSKPGALSGAEFALVQGHARAGYELLSTIVFPWPVAEIVLQHHERIDGSGYPDGRSGDDILLEARILAVADVMESMSSHRPYRPALGTDAALAELEANQGKRYDPNVVAACVTLFRAKSFSLE